MMTVPTPAPCSNGHSLPNAPIGPRLAKSRLREDLDGTCIRGKKVHKINGCRPCVLADSKFHEEQRHPTGG